MSGEPNVQRLLPRPASAAHREDLDVLRLGLQEFGQRVGEASKRALLAPPAAEKLLYTQIWQKGGGGGYNKTVKEGIGVSAASSRDSLLSRREAAFCRASCCSCLTST